MFSNKEAIVGANVDYVLAEARPGQYPVEVTDAITTAFYHANILAEGNADNSDEHYMSYAWKKSLEDEIMHAPKLIRALQQGYTEVVGRRYAFGSLEFGEILLNTNTYRHLPETFVDRYRKARRTGFFSDFLFKSPAPDIQGDQTLLGLIKVSTNYHVGPRRGMPIEQIDGAVVVRVA